MVSDSKGPMLSLLSSPGDCPGQGASDVMICKAAVTSPMRCSPEAAQGRDSTCGKRCIRIACMFQFRFVKDRGWRGMPSQASNFHVQTLHPQAEKPILVRLQRLQ